MNTTVLEDYFDASSDAHTLLAPREKYCTTDLRKRDVASALRRSAHTRGNGRCSAVSRHFSEAARVRRHNMPSSVTRETTAPAPNALLRCFYSVFGILLSADRSLPNWSQYMCTSARVRRHGESDVAVHSRHGYIATSSFI